MTEEKPKSLSSQDDSGDRMEFDRISARLIEYDVRIRDLEKLSHHATQELERGYERDIQLQSATQEIGLKQARSEGRAAGISTAISFAIGAVGLLIRYFTGGK